MLARCALRPNGLWLAPALSRAASSAPEVDPVVAKSKRKYEFYGLTEAKPGVFGGMLSSYVGERLGVTGIWTLGIGTYIFMFSKEIVQYNPETVLVIPHVATLYFLFDKGVKALANDTEKVNYYMFNRLYNRKEQVVDILQTGIDAANDVEKEVSVRTDVFDVLRSNSAMYRDTLYRERTAAVRNEILKRLQHQAELEAARRRIKQSHMITWIEREVLKDVATKLDSRAVMASCLQELKSAVDAAGKEKATA